MAMTYSLENPRPLTFLGAAKLAIAGETARARSGEISETSVKIFIGRINNHLIPHFGDVQLVDIGIAQLNTFVELIAEKGMKRSSVRLILTSLRRIFHHAYVNGFTMSVPLMPRIYSDSTPRGGFSPCEYLKLWQTARRLAFAPELARELSHRDTVGGLFSKGAPMLGSMPNLIRFMVNTFIRPTDLRWMQHKHIQVVRGRHLYLRLELPESKRHTTQIISMRPAVSIYESLLKEAKAQGHGDPEDYVFLPGLENRKSVMVLIDLHFRRVLEASGLRHGKRGQTRTLYSLRHTAITFRLLYGRGIDLLTLARNARTSVEMIERFYASELSAEMNIDLLHSRRSVAAQ